MTPKRSAPPFTTNVTPGKGPSCSLKLEDERWRSPAWPRQGRLASQKQHFHVRPGKTMVNGEWPGFGSDECRSQQSGAVHFSRFTLHFRSLGMGTLTTKNSHYPENHGVRSRMRHVTGPDRLLPYRRVMDVQRLSSRQKKPSGSPARCSGLPLSLRLKGYFLACSFFLHERTGRTGSQATGSLPYPLGQFSATSCSAANPVLIRLPATAD